MKIPILVTSNDEKESFIIFSSQPNIMYGKNKNKKIDANYKSKQNSDKIIYNEKAILCKEEVDIPEHIEGAIIQEIHSIHLSNEHMWLRCVIADIKGHLAFYQKEPSIENIFNTILCVFEELKNYMNRKERINEFANFIFKQFNENKIDPFDTVLSEMEKQKITFVDFNDTFVDFNILLECYNSLSNAIKESKNLSYKISLTHTIENILKNLEWHIILFLHKKIK